MAETINKPVALLVEGQDYYHYLIHSYGNSDILRNVWVYDFGGIAALKRFLRTFRATPGFAGVSAVGIIRDAEIDADAAQNSICDSLRTTGFAVPAAPNQVVAGVPKVGFLLIPFGQRSGCLEDACLAACTNPDALACANAFLTCVGGNPQNPNWDAKVRTRAIIASTSPGMTLGQSATKGIWNRNAASLKVIEDFIRVLY